MKSYFLLIIFVFFGNIGIGQILKGQIIELGNGNPISYSKISVFHKKRHTVSDIDGRFTLDISNLNGNDTLLISAIGFEDLNFLISHCREFMLNEIELKIELTPLTKDLEEVTVIGGKKRTMNAGNNIKSPMIISGFQDRPLGSEMGTIQKYNKKNKGLIKVLHFNSFINEPDSLKFRVNLYEVVDGIPNKSISKKPIYFYGKTIDGSIIMDISEMKIYVENDFFVSIELIENIGRKGLFFKSAFLRSPSFYRGGTDENWIKSNLDLGLWSEIEFKK
jgi:hypothetical protein